MSQQFLSPGNKYTGSFTEDTEGDGVRLNAFNHEDADDDSLTLMSAELLPRLEGGDRGGPRRGRQHTNCMSFMAGHIN